MLGIRRLGDGAGHSRYEKLLGIKVLPPAQVYVERPAIHYPTQMYDSYTAEDSGAVDAQGTDFLL